jgi:hypothetical protein
MAGESYQGLHFPGRKGEREVEGRKEGGRERGSKGGRERVRAEGRKKRREGGRKRRGFSEKCLLLFRTNIQHRL